MERDASSGGIQRGEAPVTETMPNLQFATARELFEACPQIAEDMTAQPDGRPALLFLTALAETATPEEAVTFAAYALERRHAIWWGHECLRHAASALTEHDARMMELAAIWVGQPDEDTRYAALEAAQASPAKTPGVWLAFAAGWSAGSMAPRQAPAVPVPRFVASRALNAAVLSALARIERQTRPEMLKSYVQMARMLAEAR